MLGCRSVIVRIVCRTLMMKEVVQVSAGDGIPGHGWVGRRLSSMRRNVIYIHGGKWSMRRPMTRLIQDNRRWSECWWRRRARRRNLGGRWQR